MAVDGGGNGGDGVRDEGWDGVRDDGVREDGVRDDGVRDDGVRHDGVRDDGVRDDRGKKADGPKFDGFRDKDAGAVREGDAGRGFVPWIRAVAEESWWKRRGSNPKRMGEVSQAAFLLKARTLGFGVAVPWGDSEKCDFIVWAGQGGRLLRVQVKATGRLYRGGYDVQPVYSTRGEGKKRYTAKEIDVLAAHVQTKDVWYLLPVRAYGTAKSLRFYPDLKCKRPRWEHVGVVGGRSGAEWEGVKAGRRGGVRSVGGIRNGTWAEEMVRKNA